METKYNNVEVAIESYSHKFEINTVNATKVKLIELAGSPKKHKHQDTADLERIKFDVKKIPIQKGEMTFYMWRGVIREIAHSTFIEDPFVEESHDPIKKLNYHFKKFETGNVVPVEYHLWRFAYDQQFQIKQRIFEIPVTENNFQVIQWLLQALYNDSKKPFCKLPPNYFHSVFLSLTGPARKLIKVPTEVVDSTVGVYNAVVANEKFFEEELAAQERELAAKRAVFEAAKKSKGNTKSPEIKDLVPENLGENNPDENLGLVKEEDLVPAKSKGK